MILKKLLQDPVKNFQCFNWTHIQIVVKELEFNVEVAQIQLTGEPIDIFCMKNTNEVLELISTEK